MTDGVVRDAGAAGGTWWRRRWVGRVTWCWAVAYGVFGLVCAMSGTPLLYLGSESAPAALGWVGAGVGALAGFAGGAVARYGPRSWVRGLLWGMCGVLGAGAFGLLMDVVTLMFGQGVESWVAAAHHVLAAAGVVLLAAAARAGRRPAVATGGRVPSAAPPLVQLAACAGTLAFLPYVVMKLVWAGGGTFAGVSGQEMLTISERNGASGVWLALESWGLDATALLAGVGVFLLWGLVRPWGQVFPRWTLVLADRRVPRWLPLAPALIGAATLAPYGVIGVGYCALATAGVVTVRPGDFPTSQDALLVSWIGLGAFAMYGVALATAARSYWVRTVGR
ncbi:hypothetical protein [Streptomyces apocyni]|uniref:hypothetical protein n=1 Tax=Streptomyces apocyni TaxID=2654677 RepID=UPI001E39FA0D|nr:hypothetical protein [Streptomyces apocyni]